MSDQELSELLQSVDREKMTHRSMAERIGSLSVIALVCLAAMSLILGLAIMDGGLLGVAAICGAIALILDRNLTREIDDLDYIRQAQVIDFEKSESDGILHHVEGLLAGQRLSKKERQAIELSKERFPEKINPAAYRSVIEKALARLEEKGAGKKGEEL